MMVAQLVERQGIGARTEHADALSMSRIFSWDTTDVALICLCYIENATSAQVRYAVRRIRRRVPDVFIVLALLGNADESDTQEALVSKAIVQQSLRATVERILAVASSPSEKQESWEPSRNVAMR